MTIIGMLRCWIVNQTYNAPYQLPAVGRSVCMRLLGGFLKCNKLLRKTEIPRLEDPAILLKQSSNKGFIVTMHLFHQQQLKNPL